jgi:hypothetical protein
MYRQNVEVLLGLIFRSNPQTCLSALKGPLPDNPRMCSGLDLSQFSLASSYDGATHVKFPAESPSTPMYLLVPAPALRNRVSLSGATESLK